MHVGWCAARPEGSEGGEGDGVREPDRRTRERESAGNGIRDRREEGRERRERPIHSAADAFRTLSYGVV